MLKMFARRVWVWGPLTGGALMLGVWASIYFLGLSLCPQIWGDRSVIGVENLVGKAGLLQWFWGLGFGMAATAARQFQLRSIPIVAGILGAIYGGCQLRAVASDYWFAIQDPVAVALNTHDAMTFAPAFLASLGLILVGICARKGLTS